MERNGSRWMMKSEESGVITSPRPDLLLQRFLNAGVLLVRRLGDVGELRFSRTAQQQ
jgi:hypothetical protein